MPLSQNKEVYLLKLRIAVAAVAGVLGAGLVATPSHAAWGCMNVIIHPNTDERAAQGCFNSYGDHFTIADYRADGYRAVVEWRTDYGRTGECHDSNGADNGAVDCNEDLAETGNVSIRTVIRDGSDGFNRYVTVWSPWLDIGA